MDSRHLRLGSGVGAEEGYMSNNTINGNYGDVAISDEQEIVLVDSIVF